MDSGFKCRTPALLVIFFVLLAAVLLMLAIGSARSIAHKTAVQAEPSEVSIP